MFLFDMIKAVLLGIIQGITEWLPVSSTGHMILFNSFFPMSSSLAKPDTAEFAFWGLFLVVIQLGSILAVCVLYFHKLNPFSPRKSISEKRSTWDLWFHVLVASIPGIIGIFLNDYVEKYMNNAIVVAIALIVFGIGFIVLESTKHHPKYRKVGEITYQTAFPVSYTHLDVYKRQEVPASNPGRRAVTGSRPFCRCWKIPPTRALWKYQGAWDWTMNMTL